jgi:CheY-like chemotaxis protein
MVGERGSGAAGLQAIAELLGALGGRGGNRSAGEFPGLADTVEQLRGQIDELIRRLAEGADRGSPERPEATPIEQQIETLGRKVDAASDLLAELTDILESQCERIETLEQQYGEPDTRASRAAAPPDSPARARRTVDASAHVVPLPAEARATPESSLDALPAYLESRMGRIERRVEDLELAASEVRRILAERDHQVSDLEERLLILVDSSAEQAERPSAPPPTPTPIAPMDPPASSRLAEIVERQLQIERQFAPGAVIPTGASGNAKAHPTIMVIDDSTDARTVLSIYLSKTGYQVVTAVSAEDGLAKLRNHAVDAIVVDALMAGASGEHVCNVIRKDPAYVSRRNLPIIVYTGHSEDFSRERVLSWGANDYVVKGRDMLGLMSALLRLTGGGTAEARP